MTSEKDSTREPDSAVRNAPIAPGRTRYGHLSAIDAGFWVNESHDCPLHIGYVGFGQGPAPTYGDLVAHVRDRLHLLPRHRQRIKTMAFGLTRPVWVDDPGFELSSHVRHHRVVGGRVSDPLEHISDIIAWPLDFTRPPWELWMVDGFADDTFLIVVKYHHCMMDAVGMVRLAHALFDSSPNAGREERVPVWAPRREPGDLALFTWLMRDTVPAAMRTARRLGSSGAAQGVRELLRALRRSTSGERAPAPRTGLDQPLGPRRRLVSVDVTMTDVRAIQRGSGATVNDVVLSATMSAVGRMLQRMGEPGPDELQVHVPISLRDAGEDPAAAPGNRIALIAARLPLGDPDAPSLDRTMRIMSRYKASDGGRAVAALDRASNMLPLPLLARISRRHFASDGYNLIVTNIPGPPSTYLMGRHAQRIVPLGFLTPGHPLTVAVLSYEDKLTFGLLVDPDVIEDPAQFGRDIEAAIEMLRSPRRGVAVEAG